MRKKHKRDLTIYQMFLQDGGKKAAANAGLSVSRLSSICRDADMYLFGRKLGIAERREMAGKIAVLINEEFKYDNSSAGPSQLQKERRKARCLVLNIPNETQTDVELENGDGKQTEKRSSGRTSNWGDFNFLD